MINDKIKELVENFDKDYREIYHQLFDLTEMQPLNQDDGNSFYFKQFSLLDESTETTISSSSITDNIGLKYA